MFGFFHLEETESVPSTQISMTLTYITAFNGKCNEACVCSQDVDMT